jgi:hypothetical protein
MPDRPSTNPDFRDRVLASAADTERVKLRYAIGGIAAAALLALPAGAAASQGGQVNGLAAQQCNQEKSELGKRAFRKKYGAKRTMHSCAKRTRSQVATALDTAGSNCQAELSELGADDFIDEYVDDPADLSGALEECEAEEVDQILNPDDYVDDEGDESD